MYKSIFKERQNLIDYVGSEEFNKTYQIIYNWVKENGKLDDTDIHLDKINPVIHLEVEKWIIFTDSISKKYEGYEIIDMIDNESSFRKYHFEYGALDIYFMLGKGIICCVSYNKEN